VSRSRGRGRGRRAVLDRLTVSFPPGGLTAVTGRSGSGKTTLLEILAGLAVPDGGEIVLDGRSLAGADEEGRARIRRERIGYLPQEPAPVPLLTAHENVVLALRVRGRSEADAASIAASALIEAGLPEQVRHQRVHRLSAGEAQRVALARAAACADGLLIVDEPTSRLDESGAAAVAAVLARAASAYGQTVICATHDPAIVRAADHVLELDRPGPVATEPRPYSARL
jgi:putative ABC transport system ATP-binding protein